MNIIPKIVDVIAEEFKGFNSAEFNESNSAQKETDLYSSSVPKFAHLCAGVFMLFICLIGSLGNVNTIYGFLR